MEIICQKTDLLNGINIAMKAVAAKSTMTILEYIVIDATEDAVKLIANDLELGIETKVNAQIKKDGMAAVEAKLFYEIIRKLTVEEVRIFTEGPESINIRAGRAKFHIAAKSTEEFSFLPKVRRDKKVEISEFSLKEVIRQTVFSISANENTKLMTGELFEIHADKLKVSSLDGHRISIRTVQLKQEYADTKAVIPGKTLNEIVKILSGELEKTVNMYFTERHVLFELEDTIILSRLIEGEFYNIERMISGDYETKFTVSKKELLSGIDRTTLLIRESDRRPVVMEITEDKMKMTINSEIGSMDEEIEIAKEGKDITIGFNPHFLIEALRVIDDEEVTVYMINPKAPCFIRDKEENYLYLILPINIAS